jgi:hypothetical protein
MVTPASERAKGVPRRCGFLALIYPSRNVGGDNQGNGFENTVTCASAPEQRVQSALK